MRTIFIAFFLIVCHSAMAQVSTSKTILSDEDPGCPLGLCPSVSIILDMFNFHKPRTGCSSGFGLCIKLDVSVTCHPCSPKTAIADGKVRAWLRVDGSVAELHLPKAIMEFSEFKPDDFTHFVAEDRSIVLYGLDGEVRFLREGNYPVDVRDDELVIKLALY